jgi:hypothetical protein
MYTVYAILASFANTYKLDSYPDILIQLHLHIFHENLIKQQIAWLT